MDVTYEELSKKTVAELREMAKGIDHEAIRGYSQLNKDKLLLAICTALGVEPRKKKGGCKGKGKAGNLRARIKEAKCLRDEALEDKDSAKLKQARKQLRRLKKMSRRGRSAAA